MIKKWTSYVAITFIALGVIAFALFPVKTVDMTNFSTAGLELNYTVHKDIAMLDETDKVEDIASNREFSPFLGKAYLGFKEAIAFKESRGN